MKKPDIGFVNIIGVIELILTTPVFSKSYLNYLIDMIIYNHKRLRLIIDREILKRNLQNVSICIKLLVII